MSVRRIHFVGHCLHMHIFQFHILKSENTYFSKSGYSELQSLPGPCGYGGGPRSRGSSAGRPCVPGAGTGCGVVSTRPNPAAGRGLGKFAWIVAFAFVGRVLDPRL